MDNAVLELKHGHDATDVIVQFDKLELAVCDSITNFNDGHQATLDIFENINIKPGRNTISACSSLNIKRRRSSMQHSTTMWKKRNEKPMQIRAEGKTYQAGGF